MKLRTVLCFLALQLPFPALAQIEMTIEPVETVIHVGEPVVYTITLKNTSQGSVTGPFSLEGGFDPFGIDVAKLGVESAPFQNFRMWDHSFDDGSPALITITTGAQLQKVHTIHFNQIPKSLVFREAGEYEVGFSLAWKRHPDGNVVKESILRCIGKVKVLPWHAEKDKRQLEAFKFWSDPKLSSFVQNSPKMNPEMVSKLRHLSGNYRDTLYGKLAAKVLENAKTMDTPSPKSEPEDRASRILPGQ